MERQTTTIEDELARLKEHAPEPDYLTRKNKLYNAQVTEFASMLKPAVKIALEKEASSSIADTWLDNAQQVLKTILPELPKGIELRQEFKDAAARVRRELNEQFLKEALKPSEKEIGNHTRELAQCVLANWFSILEQAKYDNVGETQVLNDNAMPRGVDHEALYEGVEAFVLPVSTVASKFMNYLDSLKQKGSVVELAPALYLVHKGEQNYLASSKDAGQNLAAAQSQLIDKQILTEAPASREAWHTSKSQIAKLMDKQMEKQVARAAAYKATQELGIYPRNHRAAELSKEMFPRQYSWLGQLVVTSAQREEGTKNMGKSMNAIGANVAHRPLYYTLARIPRTAEAQSLTSEQERLLSRISAAAVGYAISAATSKNNTDTGGIDFAKIWKFIRQNPEVLRVFNISVRTTKQALKRSSPRYK